MQSKIKLLFNFLASLNCELSDISKVTASTCVCGGISAWWLHTGALLRMRAQVEIKLKVQQEIT